MKAVAWAIVLASLFIFEGLTWGRSTPAGTFLVMCFEIGAAGQLIYFSYRRIPQEINSERS